MTCDDWLATWPRWMQLSRRLLLYGVHDAATWMLDDLRSRMHGIPRAL